MFNVYTYDRKLALADELKQLKENYIQEELLRKKKQSKLCLNYKRRIENFVLQMAEKPTIKHEEVQKIPKIREEDPSKFLGPPKMIIQAFRHEKDRIQESKERNMEYAGGYVSSPFEFRKRDTSKEIHPQMRFTTKTKLEKLNERLNTLFLASKEGGAPNSAKIPRKLDESLLLELSKSPQATNKFLAQHLLPEMNMKTHFKATECLYLNLPVSHVEKNAKKTVVPKEPTRSRQQTQGEERETDISVHRRPGAVVTFQKGNTVMLDDEKELEKKEKDRVAAEKQQNQIDIIDPSEASKDVLLKCNIIKSKRPLAHTLRKGEGHIMIMTEMNMGQIYDKVINHPIDLRASI